VTDTTLWWIALALGLVVCVVAVVLLETFLRLLELSAEPFGLAARLVRFALDLGEMRAKPLGFPS